jgi:hypothetical protein
MAEPLEMGRIVWAEIADAHGNRKLRPAVIVTPTANLESAQVIDVVAVTSRLSDPLPPDQILLPWHPNRHARMRQLADSHCRDLAVKTR